jgi:hypothetical protein
VITHEEEEGLMTDKPTNIQAKERQETAEISKPLMSTKPVIDRLRTGGVG